MDNKNEQIVNIQLQISENCTEEEIVIINAYWELKEMKFVNMSKNIKDAYNIPLHQLTNLVKSHSTLYLYVHCSNCNSYEKHQAKIQTQFTAIIKKAMKKNTQIKKCSHCRLQEVEQFNLEELNKQKKLFEKYSNAIINKNWTHLTKFDKGVLVNSLNMTFKDLKKHYGNLLGKSQFILFIKALENIENQSLLSLDRDQWTNYIVGFKKPDSLSDYREDICVQEELKESFVEVNTETDELKFKLFVDKKSQHIDGPLHSATFILKEDVILKKGVEYICALWPRANENLYLTMTPLETLEKLPVQKRISDHPISLQKGIQDFLRNLGKELDF